LLFAASQIASTDGFTAPLPTVSTVANRFGTELHSEQTSTGFSAFAGRKSMNVPGGEEQRKYRRTVYTHDDWKKHRSPDRFIYYLSAVFNSGVYKNLSREVTTTTAVAAFVCGWNALTGTWTDVNQVTHPGMLQGVFPMLTMPLAFFTLSSPSLGLLLVFRTNTSYQRWDEARKNWGMNINHTRDLVRMANAYYDRTGVSDEERAADLRHTALCTWAFVRAMKRHLSPEWEDEQAFQIELYEKLPQIQAQKIIDAAHRPNRALQDLSYAVDNLPMHFLRKNEIHRAITIFEDDLGSSERILTSPVPVFYSRHLLRYLSVWLLLLPFALYDPFSTSWNHVAMIPATTVISVFLFGIEELGTQLEEPFTILPMQAFCDKIYNWCIEIVSWSPGDNGMVVKAVKPEHAYFLGGATQGSAAPSGQYQQDTSSNMDFDEFLRSQGQ
jgi:predicted membrane chloride channel (bestrophin family)